MITQKQTHKKLNLFKIEIKLFCRQTSFKVSWNIKSEKFLLKKKICNLGQSFWEKIASWIMWVKDVASFKN